MHMYRNLSFHYWAIKHIEATLDQYTSIYEASFTVVLTTDIASPAGLKKNENIPR